MARPSDIRSVLLDASCLIGVIKGEPDMHCLQSLLVAIERGDVRLVESTAILAEVLPDHDSDDSGADSTREAILSLLESTDVELVDVSVPVARKAADFRVRYGMRTWDAVHLATGVVAGVDVVMARDGKFPFDETLEQVFVSKPFDIDDDKLPIGRE